MRQAGDSLMGGASGAGSLLLNTKASQEAACSRAPAAIVSGQEPESHGAGVSRFSGNSSHPAEVDGAESHAGQVDGPGMSGNAKNGSHLAAADFSSEPGAVLWRHTPPRRTESGLLSYGTASPDSSVQKTALWCTRGSSWHRGLRAAVAARAGAAEAELRAVADNTLIIKQKSTLPVSKTRQGQSLFRLLSDTYLPLVEQTDCRDRRNVCLAARFLSLSPHAVNSNIRPAENQQAEPCGEHRRRNVRSPAATDRALRGARRKALLAPDCCPRCLPCCRPNCHSSRS